MVDIYRHSRMGKTYQVVLTGTLRCPLTAIFFMDLTTTKRCLLTFSIKFTKKKNFFFHTYMVFVGCTWHPWIPPHTFVKSHFMYLTSTKRCLLTFFIQFTEKNNNNNNNKNFHTYMVFVGARNTLGFQHTHLSKLIYELVPKVFKISSFI